MAKDEVTLELEVRNHGGGLVAFIPKALIDVGLIDLENPGARIELIKPYITVEKARKVGNSSHGIPLSRVLEKHGLIPQEGDKIRITFNSAQDMKGSDEQKSSMIRGFHQHISGLFGGLSGVVCATH